MRWDDARTLLVISRAHPLGIPEQIFGLDVAMDAIPRASGGAFVLVICLRRFGPVSFLSIEVVQFAECPSEPV